jgi:uncharacterized protein (TIGR03437 family)
VAQVWVRTSKYHSGMRFAIFLILPCIAGAQLVKQNAVPIGSIPVVFLDGYQLGCLGDSSFNANFGNAETVLQASGLVTLYFDNCSVPGVPPIETLGAAFGQFLASLTYTDGTTVPLVDVVAHSMGGLIVRAYLSGMQVAAAGTPAIFAPPPTPGIRKAVFLATPHFGTYVATAIFGVDKQTTEMALGSQFLFDLNTWNQGTDDLRGVDALAIAGNGGTGLESIAAGSFLSGFDDGVVELTSASIGFAIAGRTRVVPDCHSSDPLVVTEAACLASTPAIAQINNASNVVGQIVTSFITGTSAWTTLGQAIEANTNGSTIGGLLLGAQDLNGVPQIISSAASGTNMLGVNAAVYKEALPANKNLPLQVNVSASTALSPTVTLSAGTTSTVIAKPGPSITGVVPAGIAQFPRDVAPGAFVTIYGSNLASIVTQSPQPYPTQLGEVQVLVNGIAAQVEYTSPSQINFIFPVFNNASGMLPLTVKNSTGQQTVNVMLVPVVPSIFTSTGVASGPAAAENAVTGTIIGANTPLHAGDYVALFLTGIDEATSRFFSPTSTVTVGGQSCAGPYFFAGPVASYEGLDQVNCQIPSGVTGASVPVIVTTDGRASNTATLNIQ